MKRFKVLAINKNLEEVQKWFDNYEDAEKYAELCESKGCFSIIIKDFKTGLKKVF